MDISTSQSTPAMPSADMEPALHRYARTRDLRLRDALVNQHQGLVRYAAAKFVTRGEQFEDLVQVGNFALIKALDRYDPSRHTSFSTYAFVSIVGEIKRHFRDNVSTMKVPRHLQEGLPQVLRAQSTLTSALGRTPTPRQIAEHIGAQEDVVLEILDAARSNSLLSLDSFGGSDTDGDGGYLPEVLGAPDGDLTRIDAHADLYSALDKLERRERQAILLGYFHELSQHQIAAKMGVSQMHVSRLQRRALTQLKELMR